MISGFHHERDENCPLLGYYAVTGLIPVGCSETSVRNLHY